MSAILFILALTGTPLRYVWPQAGFTVWLLRNRRYLGVASFGYALLHTLFYLIDAGSLSKVFSQLPILEIWTGWLSLLIMVPLAFTSSGATVRKLRRQWKPLQRWAYAAAVLALLRPQLEQLGLSLGTDDRVSTINHPTDSAGQTDT